MMRAINMTIAALGLLGAALATAPAPASAQMFWPGIYAGSGFGAPHYSFHRPPWWAAYVKGFG